MDLRGPRSQRGEESGAMLNLRVPIWTRGLDLWVPISTFGVVLVTNLEMSRIPSHSVEYITKCKAYTPYSQALDYAQSLIEMVTPSDNLGATHR